MGFPKKRGKMWYWYHYEEIDGERKQIATPVSPIKAKCLEFGAKISHESPCASLGLVNERKETKDALNEYLEINEAQWKESTKKTNKPKIGILKEYFKNRRFIKDIKSIDADKLEVKLRGMDLGPRSINKYFETFKGFLNFCVKHGYIRENPFKDWKNKKTPKRQIKFLKEEEMDLIEKHMKKHTPDYYPFIMFLRYTGFRHQEMINTKKAWVMDGYIDMSVSKSGWTPKNHPSVRKVKISKKLEPIVKQLMKESTDEYLFSHLKSFDLKQANRVLHRITNIIKIETGTEIYATCHKYRHAVGTKLGNMKYSAEMIAKVLGHSETKSTQIYIDIQQESIDNMVDKI